MTKYLKQKLNNAPEYVVGYIVVAVGLTVRFLWLGADPPLYFRDMGQDLLTDPYNVVHFARNKILFGSWDIFDFNRWIVFKYSLSSAFCYLFFLIGEVSRVIANLSATLLNLAGLGLYIFAHRKSSRLSALIVSGLLLTNMTLIVYGRYPFLENGLIFFCGLLCFLFFEYFPRNWVLILTGFLIALCVLSGKIFGLVMIIPVGAVLLADDKKQFIRRFALILASLVISLPLLAFLYYGKNLGVLYGYITEQTVGMYGWPKAFTSPIKFLEQFMTFGITTKLFHFSPFMLLLLFLGLCRLVLTREGTNRLKENRFLIFNLAWLLAGFLLLMPFNYQALRYQLFLILPISGIIAEYMADTSKHESIARMTVLKIGLLLVLCWYTSTIFITIARSLIIDWNPAYSIAWYALLPAVIVTALIYSYRRLLVILEKNRCPIGFLLLALCIATQFVWLYKWYDHKSYCLKQDGEDLAQIVNSNAVIVGPYAAALTIDNNLKSFIYMFGLTEKEPDLFDRFPLTHLALDLTNWDKAVEDYPGLNNSRKITLYWVRDVEISVVKINRGSMGVSDVHYMTTDFEKSADYYNSARFPDSVYYYVDRFLKGHPTNKSGLRLLRNHYLAGGATDRGYAVDDRLIELYPDDYSMYFEKARAYYLFYATNRNRRLLEEANRYFGMAKSVNPYIDDDIINTIRYTDSVAAKHR